MVFIVEAVKDGARGHHYTYMELLVYDQLWDMASKVGGALIVQ